MRVGSPLIFSQRHYSERVTIKINEVLVNRDVCEGYWGRGPMGAGVDVILDPPGGTATGADPGICVSSHTTKQLTPAPSTALCVAPIIVIIYRSHRSPYIDPNSAPSVVARRDLLLHYENSARTSLPSGISHRHVPTPSLSQPRLLRSLTMLYEPYDLRPLPKPPYVIKDTNIHDVKQFDGAVISICVIS